MEAEVTHVVDDDTIHALDFAVLQTVPPLLLIHAWGQVPCTGWSNARLVSRAAIQPTSDDDTLDLDFVVTAPIGVAIQTSTLIPVNATMELPVGISRFRVHGQDNLVEKLLPSSKDAQQVDNTSCKDGDFIPIPWVHSNSGAVVGVRLQRQSEVRTPGLNWQTIDLQQQQTGSPPNQFQFVRTERAKISGGWLVRTVLLLREQTQPTGGATDIETAASIGLTFVPDTAGWN